VTKQYATFLENYFKGMETLKELYWESLRAPNDAVNLARNPYVREYFLKKKMGKTRDERIATGKMWKANHKKVVADTDAGLLEESKLGIGTPMENHEKNVETAKARRRLGFIDLEVDAAGNTINAEDGLGVVDPVMNELKINSDRYLKSVQEQRARKKIDITTPVAGISREEFQKGMLREDEMFKDV